MTVINLCKAWKGRLNVVLLPVLLKTMKWTEECVLFLLQMSALNCFIVLKKYYRDQNEKVGGCTFKDFVLDCVQKIAALAWRRGE